MVNDLDDRVGPSNADVKYRHDVPILGNDVVVAEPCEIDHVGNTCQYVVTAVRCPDVSTAPGKVVERGYCEVGMQICLEAREVALDSDLEILFHHSLVSLVLGLNSGPICVAIHKTPPLIRERLPTRRQSPEAQVQKATLTDAASCRVRRVGVVDVIQASTRSSQACAH